MSTTGPVLVTGGAGFIGSAVVRRLVAAGNAVVNVDALTYAGHLESLAAVVQSPLHEFVHMDVADARIAEVFETHRPRAVLHLAAESHVDRSIDGAAPFIHTNVHGTFNLLEAARAWHASLDADSRARFRFVHVSTDEVFGDLGESGYFQAGSPYAPSSPYAASKAAADHLARAWQRTYGLPVVVTNCSNNYGPYQFPEKLIPLVTLRGAAGRSLPVYGRGDNVRDWLHVEDHVDGLLLALERGRPGETYLFGGHGERTNLEVVRAICAALDRRRPQGAPHDRLIELVAERPGHDRRYAIDPSSAEQGLDWRPKRSFEDGIEETVEWYLRNEEWCAAVTADGAALDRIGLGGGR